jgi:hypothetical protein
MNVKNKRRMKGNESEKMKKQTVGRKETFGGYRGVAMQNEESSKRDKTHLQRRWWALLPMPVERAELKRDSGF